MHRAVKSSQGDPGSTNTVQIKTDIPIHWFLQEENANEKRHHHPRIFKGELRWPEMQQGLSYDTTFPIQNLCLQPPKAFMRLCWCVSGVWGWLVFTRTHKVILAATSPLQKGWQRVTNLSSLNLGNVGRGASGISLWAIDSSYNFSGLLLVNW